MITPEDVLLFFPTLLEIVFLAFVISRLITFIPSFMVSVVRSVKNKSIIYSDDTKPGSSLETNLDRGELGIKTLMNRWFS